MTEDVHFINPELPDSAEEFSNKIFLKKRDIKILLESAIKNKKEEVFAALAFNGKYLVGLTKVLRNGSGLPEVKNLEQVKKDISGILEKIVSDMKILISFAIEPVRKQFEDQYFILSKNSLDNLKLIADDFEKIKVFINHQKHRKRTR